MNEKTTKSDMDLKIRKMEFLENFLAFAKQVNKRLMRKFPHKNIKHKQISFFEEHMKMLMTLYKSNEYISLEIQCLDPRWSECRIDADMHSTGTIWLQYKANFDTLKKFADIPFEEFTNTFEKLFAELEEEPEKISIDVTQEQLDKINEHGII